MDRAAAGIRPLYAFLKSPRPLAWLALGAMAGVELGDAAPPASMPWTMAAALGLALFAWWRGGFASLLLLSVLSFTVWEQAALQESGTHPLRGLLESAGGEGGEVIMTGRVERALRRDLPGSAPGAFWFHAREIIAPRLHRRLEGLTVIRLHTDRRTTLSPGEYRIVGSLRLSPLPDNPGQIDFRDRDMRRGIVAECRAKSIRLIHRDAFNFSAMLNDGAENCREWIKAQLGADLDDAPTERTLIQAVILGGSETGAGEVEKPFRETGTVHIFAVAGLHVGMIGLILAMFLRALGVSRKAMLLALVPVLFAYAFITGLRPSTVRAATMAAVFLCGAPFQRRSDILNSLGAAALLLLVADVQQFFSIGFRLSFSVIAAIALLEPLFRWPFRRWIEPDPFFPKVLLNVPQRWWRGLKAHVVSLFSVSAAATCGSLPLMLTYFRIVTPSAIVANMVLVPIAFGILFTCVVTLLSAVAHVRILQVAFCNANFALAKAACFFAQMFANLPAAHCYLAPFHLSADPPVEFTVLRLPGAAAAQHLRVGGDHWVLDCGQARDFPFLLHPYLQHCGVNSLAGLLLSHNGSGYVGGVTGLQQEYSIHAIYHTALEPWKGESSRSGLKKLYKMGLHAHLLSKGNILPLGHSAGMEVLATVLYPPLDVSPSHADDRAMVVRLDIARHRVLWCNNSGFIAEKAMLDAFPQAALQCDVIVRNQRVSDLSMTDEFLDAVRPRILISSNSPFPTTQKLSPRLRETCRKRGIRLLDQAQTGAVTISIWPERMEFRAFREGGKEPVVLGVRPGAGHKSYRDSGTSGS